MDMIFIYFSSEDLGILLGFFLAKKLVKKIIIIQLPTIRSDSLVLLRSNDRQYVLLHNYEKYSHLIGVFRA